MLTMFLRNSEKYYKPIYFSDNSSFLFPTVKEFSKSVNNWWSYCRCSSSRFLKHIVSFY